MTQKTWRRPPAEPRAVLSVAFSAEEFGAVNRAAEAAGQRTSAFVRDAALRRSGFAAAKATARRVAARHPVDE